MVRLAVVAAVVEPSLLILQVLRHLIKKSLGIVLKVYLNVLEVLWSFLIFRILRETLFQLLRGERA